MTTPATPMDTVTLERRIAARPEAVFGFFTDRDRWLSWMGDAEATFSFEPGGPYRTRVSGENVASGRFLTLDPPERLVLTWNWEGSPPLTPAGPTRLEITLAPTPAGTVLHLTHSGLPTTESCEAHAELWQHYIDRLAQRAENTDPGPDPWSPHTNR
ncbi:SRPBCC family protein [Streptomyces sp. NPDC002104]